MDECTGREATLREFIDRQNLNENHLIKRQLKEYEERAKEKLSASEAIFGFCGWLTSRKEIIPMGSSEDCAVVAKLVEEYCKRNKLSGPSEEWHKKLVPPLCGDNDNEEHF